MSIVVVTRHSGARAWLSGQGITVDSWLSHLNVNAVKQGDCVIGSLPVQMVAQLTAKGVRYINLSLSVPEHLRGQELTAEQMEQCAISLEEIRAVSHGTYQPSSR